MSEKPALPEKPAMPIARGGAQRFLSERVRPKDSRRTLRGILVLFKDRVGIVVLVFGLVSVGVACGLLVPWLIGRAIDSAIGHLEFSPLGLVLILGVVYAVDAAVAWVQSRVMAGFSQRLVRDLRQTLFSRIAKLPIAFFDSHGQGDVMSRMSNDTDNIAIGLAQSGSQLLASLVGVAGALAFMLVLSPLLTLVVVVTVPLVFLLTAVVSRRTRVYFKQQQAALGALNSHLEETVNGFLEIKVFDRCSQVVERFEALNENLRAVGTKAQVWAGLVMPLMNVINNFGFTALAGYGGWLNLGGWVSVGLIASFVGYSRQFGRPLNDIANTWNTLQNALAGAERVFEVLDEMPEPPDGPQAIQLRQVRGEIEFDRVNFGYQPNHLVLKDISLRVPAGSSVALVGPTGSGKTTLVNHLLRFYDPNSGAVYLDGQDIRNYSRSSLRQSFGVVLQDTWLFEGSIADNIRYGRPEASLEEVIAAAASANADGFIRHLPRQYQTVLGPGTDNLSQGQRQLLAIARAVLVDAPLLILDEATSNIDTRTEFMVQQAMLGLMRGRTCFIIAHRLSTIRDADLIILIDGGRILESGTHLELLRLGGHYAALYRP